MLWLILIIVLLLYILRYKSNQKMENFYQFLTPTSLNIPDMFMLSDQSMEEIFDVESRIPTFKQRGLCK